MRPPARALVGNLIWSADGGVWALWRVTPFPHSHTAARDKLSVHARLRGLLISLPPNAMLLSVCERLDPLNVVTNMAEGVDLDGHPTWADVCDATADWLGQVALYRRRYYLAVELPSTRRPWLELLRGAAADVSGAFGIGPSPIGPDELETRRRQAREIEVRLASNVPVSPVTAGEVCWLYARALRREAGEPPFDHLWEPARPGEGAVPPRARGVLAQLTDAVVKEGGYGGDPGRPRHRRYVRIDGPGGTSYQTVLAMADMPHYFAFPSGGGEWLFYADHVGFPVDWCVRVRAVRNVDAQAKVRRKHRDLVGQVDEYDGEVTGAPPQLAEAIQAIDDERAELGANPMEPELQVTILMSVAAPTLSELEDKSGALSALFEPQEYGLGRPTGGQAALLRSMLPGTAAAPVCHDYTQFMLSRDLAAGSPYCGPEVGDPSGLLLGVSLDGGTGTPVLFDPAYGPKANASPSLAAVGRLGSGKSYFLKRLCWDTVARGGQVVTIDRTRSGEYVRFAESVPARIQVVRLEAGADVCLDPLRSFEGSERSTVTLGFLSLLAGCSPHSDEGTALAEAVDAVAALPGAGLSDVVDELARMGDSLDHPDPAARALARRLAHYRRSATGRLAFGDGRALSLDADFIVFWAPNLALPDREMLESEYRSRMMLPEQVLGQALLYLVAAVGRRVVFSDPTRFAAALYDEAWALLASPYGQNLLIEGVRDGRKHNGAIWLASQHPNDFAISELADLLGSRFVFRQARQAIPAALRFLGAADSVDAAATLEHGLGNGQCLYRDVRERIGLIQVLPPVLTDVEPAFETAPAAARPAVDGGRPAVAAADLLTAAAAPDDAPEIGPPEPDLPSTAPLGPAEPGAAAGADPAAGPDLSPSSGPLGADGPDHSADEDAAALGGHGDPAAAARARVRRRRRPPLATALQRRDD
ncbi:MAG TPA: ATP-binding protein [Acidimicrobiales bacterium]